MKQKIVEKKPEPLNFDQIGKDRFLMKINKRTKKEEIFFVKEKERNETFTDGFVTGISLTEILDFVIMTAAVIAADDETIHLCDYQFRKLTKSEKATVEEKVNNVMNTTILENKKLIAKSLGKKFEEPTVSIEINVYKKSNRKRTERKT